MGQYAAGGHRRHRASHYLFDVANLFSLLLLGRKSPCAWHCAGCTRLVRQRLLKAPTVASLAVYWGFSLATEDASFSSLRPVNTLRIC